MSVSKRYLPPSRWLRPLVRTATDQPVEALRDVSFSVAPGEIVGLVGPNGAGKTTLLKIIATLLEPTAGQVRVAGADVSERPLDARRQLGVVLADDRGLYWRLDGRQNLEFFGVVSGLPSSVVGRRADALLHRAGLHGRDRMVFGYSSGMRAQLSIARSLLLAPPLLLLDEPSRSLDPLAAADLGRMLGGLASDGHAVLLSSHRLEEVSTLCDRVVVLVEGTVRYVGPPAELGGGESGGAGGLAAFLARESTPREPAARLPSEGERAGEPAIGDLAVAPKRSRVRAVAKRDLAIELTYPVQFALRFSQLVLFAATLFFISKLVQQPEVLRRFGGDYFEFALVGLIVTSFATVGLGAFSKSIAEEQRAGTLEILLTVPTPPPTLLAGALVVPLGLAAANAVAYLLLGGLLGVRLPIRGLVLAVPLLVLTIGTFCGLGILSAAFIVLTKRGDPLALLLSQATTFLAGTLFPVTLLPAPLEVLTRAVPAYYGLEGMRQVLLERAGTGAVVGEILVLVAFNAVLLPLALYCFSRSVRVARVTGTLGNY